MRLRLWEGEDDVFKIRVTEDETGIIIQGGGDGGCEWGICRLIIRANKLHLARIPSISDTNIAVDVQGRIVLVEYP